MRQPITAEDLYAFRFVGDPRLSPDGSRVAFVVTVADRERNDYRSRIWLVPTAGSAPPRPLTAGTGKDTSPRWSPDGRRLAFVSDRAPQTLPPHSVAGERPRPQIWALDLSGGEARQVTALRQGAADPSWSPDGRQIACTSQTGGPDDAPPDGTKSAEERARERADRVREITTLKYKFDGLGYLDDRRRHLFLAGLPAEGAALAPARQLTRGDHNNSQPVWSPDGGSDRVHLLSRAGRGRHLPLRSLDPRPGGRRLPQTDRQRRRHDRPGLVARWQHARLCRASRGGGDGGDGPPLDRRRERRGSADLPQRGARPRPRQQRPHRPDPAGRAGGTTLGGGSSIRRTTIVARSARRSSGMRR